MVITRIFLLSFSPLSSSLFPPPKMIGNLKLLFVSGKTGGRESKHFFEAAQPRETLHGT